MSHALINAAIAMPLPPARRAVLLALSDMANHAGTCWPSIATLARRACMSVRSIFTHLKALEGMGLLTRRQRIGRSSLYSLTGQALAPSTPTASAEQATSAQATEPTPTPQPAAEVSPAPVIAPVVLTVGSVVKAMRDVGMLGAYDCAPLAALVADTAPAAGLTEFTAVAAEAVAKHKGFPWVLTVVKNRRADRAQADTARTTVPSTPGRDPVLIAIEQDAAQAAPPSSSIRETLARLKAEIVGGLAGAGA